MTWRQRRSGLIVPEDRVWTPDRKKNHLMAGIVAGQAGGGGGGPTDPNFANVRILAHMDGANAGVVFTDVIGATITPTQFVTDTTIKKFGSASAKTTGSGALLELTHIAAYQPGSGNFTVECWAYKSSAGITSNPGMFSSLGSGLGDAAFYCYCGGAPGSDVNFGCYDTGGSPIGTINTSGVTVDTWHHVAYVRNGTVFSFYLNGVQTGSQPTSSATVRSAGVSKFHIGKVLGISSWDGYIDDFRYTVGVARYTSNFTPPAAAFPNS